MAIVKNKGQTSLILILLAAMAMTLFAISMNWGRIAEVKTVTMTGATQGAAMFASNFASYGERVLQTSLGGQWKICKSNSILGAIIGFVLAVIIAIVCWACGPAALLVVTQTLLVISVVLAAMNLVLQVAVVQPGLTRLWNKMQQNLPVTDQFLEQGLQNGLQAAVSDQAQITDYFDLNTNGRFGASSGRVEDTVGRFGFYYTERLKSIQPPDTTDISSFLSELRNFTSGGTSTYSLPLLGSGCDSDKNNVDDPHCNSCCVPLQYSGGQRPAQNQWGTTCSTDADQPTECMIASPWKYAPSYPLTYDPTYPMYRNFDNTGSFLAKFGLDAEARSSGDPTRGVVSGGFDPQDTLPVSTGGIHGGIFSFLWDMDYLHQDPNYQPSSTDPSNPYGANQLDSRYSDSVGSIANFEAADNDCAQYEDPTTGFWWKKGTDLYCSTVWPYDQCTTCPALGPNQDPSADNVKCGCTAATATHTANDPLDDFVYGLKQFEALSQKLQATDPTQLVNTMDQWYPNMAVWIGPPCSVNGNTNVCYRSGSYDGGFLYRIHNQGVLGKWESLLNGWLTGTYTAANAWCLPSDENAFRSQHPTEYNAIVAHGAWGSLNSVIACLDYNSSAPTTTANDNVAKFTQCENDAVALCPSGGALPASCSDLPRSLAGDAPAFDICASPSKYRQWLANSITLAGAQEVRFKTRHDFLTGMQKKAQDLLPVLSTFDSELGTFLASPGLAALYSQRASQAAQASSGTGQLPNSVVYGWRDQNAPKNAATGQTVGYWHIVKVEGQVPGRCSGYGCLTDRLPWVRTYTKGFLGMTRCYELTDYAGNARMKVTRWDEDHTPLSFANKMPIWRMIFHPSSVAVDASQLDRLCGNQFLGMTPATLNLVNGASADPNIMNDSATRDLLGHAFMYGGAPPDSCAELAEQLLANGVSSQVCAHYDLNADKTHLTVKFIPCS